MNKRFLRLITLGLAWLMITAAVSAALYPIQAARFSRIEANSSMTAAVIQDKECQDHGQVTYAFEVDQRTYTGARSMGEICSSATKGQHINIYYNALNPMENTPYNPSSELNSRIQSIILEGMLLSSFITWRIANLWNFGKA